MAFFGKQFVLESQENFDGFVESFGAETPDAFKKALINHKGTVKLEKDGDGFKFITSNVDGSNKEIAFKSGVQFVEKLHGRDANTTITLDGNVLTQVQKFENDVVFTYLQTGVLRQPASRDYHQNRLGWRRQESV